MAFFKKTKSLKEEKTALEEKNKKEFLTKDLLTNVNKFKKAFDYPANTALKLRDLHLPFYEKNITILYVEATVDTNLIDTHIVEPLLEEPDTDIEKADFVSSLIKDVLTSANAKEITSIQDAVKDLVNGNTIIVIENEEIAISVETVGFENRSVAEPTAETVIVGPKIAFIESAAVNRSLIRSLIRDPKLMCESITVGDRAPQQISVMYLKEIADPAIVEKVKKRLTEINSDTVMTLSIMEQHLEERPYSLFPSTLTTERPDRAASFLLEGHIILVMDNSPDALVVPITFWALFHTVEDQYLRMPYGNFIRIIRLFSLFVAVFTPALYIAVTTFHAEMIPTDLMLAIAATREVIPFPVFVEILIMGITFEILREAGVRVPNTLGPTIGIVGALILGQAAVEANIVSPTLVVVIAVTGLASFTIPDTSLNVAIRILGFALLLAANFLGIFGISVFLSFLIAYLVSIKSYGVPFFAPLSPHLPSSKDMLVRPPVWKQWLRPFSAFPQDKARAGKPKGDQG
ncbi:spore germination protein [Lederbergia citrea]|uniref:Spore germination protein n=1 Tax=Lederbergia citrea TaxID=2833581 RepID=A0A942US83_9BACI|nr:spore germination protein [Lederbergia citrea]MBS4224043.1 spore germination protein [Lederbergia citrea]